METNQTEFLKEVEERKILLHELDYYIKENSWFNQLKRKTIGNPLGYTGQEYLDSIQQKIRKLKTELNNLKYTGNWELNKKYDNKDKDISEYLKPIKNIYDKSCTKISGVVGTGIHLYTTALNHNHFQDIYNDFTNERYLSGILKTIIPYALPYAVSFYARKKAKKESQQKINELEKTIQELRD